VGVAYLDLELALVSVSHTATTLRERGIPGAWCARSGRQQFAAAAELGT
jgi:hypothetical protein